MDGESVGPSRHQQQQSSNSCCVPADGGGKVASCKASIDSDVELQMTPPLASPESMSQLTTHVLHPAAAGPVDDPDPVYVRQHPVDPDITVRHSGLRKSTHLTESSFTVPNRLPTADDNSNEGTTGTSSREVDGSTAQEDTSSKEAKINTSVTEDVTVVVAAV